jgi:hypothetical protein
MHARLLAVAFLSSLVCSSGCVSSVRPLSDETTSMPDLTLLGTWEVSDPEKLNEKQVITVTRKKDSKTVLHAVGKDGEKKEESDLYCTKIGNNMLLSAMNEENGKQVYAIAKYQLTGDTSLKLWALDNEFFAAAVTKKELKGAVKKKEFFVDVLLDETPENLHKFIEKHGAKCFSNKELELKVKKIKPAE